MSRRTRLEHAMQPVEEAQSEVECLKDELTNWLENMPENLQDGAKAEALQEAIDQLDQVYDSLTEAIESAGSVEFPGMFG